MSEHKIHILTGSNLGNRQKFLAFAEEMIDEKVGPVVCKSEIYESEAWGNLEQPNFYNQVLVVNSTLSAEAILEITQSIEKEAKRVKKEHWGARNLDIDLLFYDQEIINEKHLKIPHPWLQERKFTLLPLNEVAPEYIHPKINKNVTELLDICRDQGKVWKISNEA